MSKMDKKGYVSKKDLQNLEQSFRRVGDILEALVDYKDSGINEKLLLLTEDLVEFNSDGSQFASDVAEFLVQLCIADPKLTFLSAWAELYYDYEYELSCDLDDGDAEKLKKLVDKAKNLILQFREDFKSAHQEVKDDIFGVEK